MKPKTDRQREVAKLSEGLRPITEAQRRWGADHAFIHEAYYSKHRAWCSECGGSFHVDESPLSIDLLKSSVTCRHCGRQLKLVKSRKRKAEVQRYFTIITHISGWQVFRHFRASKVIRAGEAPSYDFDEVVQNWIDAIGKEVVMARPLKPMMGGYRSDAWDADRPMEIRSTNRRLSSCYYDLSEKYKIGTTCVYLFKNITPILRQRGFTGRDIFNIPQSEIAKMLLTDRESETWIKNKLFGLLALKWTRGWKSYSTPVSTAAKIAIRHHYAIKDASMWADYIDLLAHFHLDIHNPHYVCPSNLKAEHDKLMKRKQRAEERRKAEERLKQKAEWEEQYAKDKGRFFGICIAGAGLTINPIKSVAEMAEEGKEMKHCVFAAEYFKKPKSLILTARDTAGNRLETVEVSLDNFQIVQARAKFNGTSPRHQDIIDLILANMNQIREASAININMN